MPRRKEVKSLVEACLDNICENIDIFWCANFCKNVSRKDPSIIEGGPFKYLPGALVSEITAKLRNKHLLEKKHLPLLITSTLERLDLSWYGRIKPVIYDLIATRCKYSLKELSISKMPKTRLIKVVEAFINLEVLHLRYTETDDSVLAIIGSNCSKLRELDVGGCTGVTDRGMENLFAGSLSEGGSNRYGKCKLLSRLHIIGTKVGIKGIEAALRNFPNLQYLDHPDVLLALERMHMVEWRSGVQIPPYSLTTLCVSDANRRGFLANKSGLLAVSMAVDICPLVNKVIIRFNRTPETNVLESLCKLKNLKTLSIEGDATSESHVVPLLLKAHGQLITDLRICFCLSGHVGIIGVCCPVLEYLVLITTPKETEDERDIIATEEHCNLLYVNCMR